MCDECDESTGLYLAYFNKPGGKRWRPPQKAASAPLMVDRQAVPPPYPSPQAEEGREGATVREVRRYSCD
jgi:hypothetical protein